jgi:hypothetical protein
VVLRQLIDAVLEIGLGVHGVGHVAAVFFDRKHAFKVPLKGLYGELQTRQFPRQPNHWGVPVQCHQKRLLDVFEYLVFQARGREA